MPPKSNGAPAAKAQETSPKPDPRPTDHATINQRSIFRYGEGNPLAAKKKELGLHVLAPAERAAWTSITYVRSAQDPKKLPLSAKATRELWKSVNESGIPLRGLDHLEGDRERVASSGKKVYDWGVDRAGRDIGEYTPAEFQKRKEKRLRITRLELQGRVFQNRRRTVGGFSNLGEDEVEKERERRRELGRLRMELYSEKATVWSEDPEWDDITPIPQVEGEEALASIAYSEDYAMAISYLRAVMAKKEHTPRCLRLTEAIIMMNPAHYTVWLYRFAIISTLNISIPDEIQWLNRVSLIHLKNYQIWHHRQLLIDYYFPIFAPPPGAEAATTDNSPEFRDFALSELAFLKSMLDEDAKNYHVWSYRQYLVRKLGIWNLAEEMNAVENLILEDVRNNSAWSHRFFLVFSNPANATTQPEPIPATRHDPKVPAEVTEREAQYAMRKIEEAPQNQSSWNYLRGVLVRGGKPLTDVEQFCLQFVRNLDDGEEKEQVKSSHALDMLADIWGNKGEKEKADVALRRLAEKWDRVREGYWNWKRRALIEARS